MQSLESFQKEIKSLREDFIQQLTKAQTNDELEQIRITFLSRKGVIPSLMEKIKELSLENKKIMGPLLNTLKQELQDAYLFKHTTLTNDSLSQELAKKKSFDVTAYLPHNAQAHLHPLTIFLKHIEQCVTAMGYEIVDGPEVETDYYNFEALNIPADHPARDMWDTFWLDVPSLLLRTHTSPVQIHAMQKRTPPMAIIAPGRCYRHEATDASHDFLFMQLEGLLIDKNISMANLLASVKMLMQAIFQKNELNIRVRPSYFPFVEPGIEFDIECPFCTQGCSTCKHSRWIEMGGAGLIHPRVLEHGGIDSNIYSGFAFGFGLTRLAMLRYSIDDIRLLHSGSISFLDQF